MLGLEHTKGDLIAVRRWVKNRNPKNKRILNARFRYVRLFMGAHARQASAQDVLPRKLNSFSFHLNWNMHSFGHRNVSRCSRVKVIMICRRRGCLLSAVFVCLSAKRNCDVRKNERRIRAPVQTQWKWTEHNEWTKRGKYNVTTTLSPVIVNARCFKILNIASTHFAHKHTSLLFAISSSRCEYHCVCVSRCRYRAVGCCQFGSSPKAEASQPKGKRNGKHTKYKI